MLRFLKAIIFAKILTLKMHKPNPRATFARREASNNTLEQAVEAQYRQRASRYQNLDYISEKYSKYLDNGGGAKEIPPYQSNGGEMSSLDYRA